MASSLPLLVLLLCSLSMSQAMLRVFNLRATGLPYDALGITDAYVKVFCGSASLGKTATRDNDINPWWKEEFANFNVVANDVLKLEVHDSDLVFDDLVGTCQQPVVLGTYAHECMLEKGGTLHYEYTLS